METELVIENNITVESFDTAKDKGFDSCAIIKYATKNRKISNEDLFDILNFDKFVVDKYYVKYKKEFILEKGMKFTYIDITRGTQNWRIYIHHLNDYAMVLFMAINDGKNKFHEVFSGKNLGWIMPEWMEKYRESINNTGGNSVEELMNDKSTLFNNAPRAVLSCCVSAQVGLLESLKQKGIID